MAGDAPAIRNARSSATVRERRWFLPALAAIGCIYGAFAVAAGRRLLLSGHLFPPDVLFGCDVDRAIRVIAEPGFVNPRSNVHPLFAVLTRPGGLLLGRLGITPGMAAIMLNAGAGCLGLWFTAWYLRLRGMSRAATVLAVWLMASGTTWLVQSALPGTPIFSLAALALVHVLLAWTVMRPDGAPRRGMARLREGLWVAGGVVNYGLTVTNGALVVLARGFAERGWRSWAAAVRLGVVVLALGMALSWAVGSDLNLLVERQWVVDETVRGRPLPRPLWHSMQVNLVWSVVAPVPTLTRTTDARGWEVLTFLDWRFTPAGWALALGWLLVLAMAAAALARCRSGPDARLDGALLAGLGFHIVLHRFYVFAYEGVFLWSAHGYFMLIVLTASLLRAAPHWPPWRRRALMAGLALGAAGMTLHNGALLWTLGERVPLPPGYGPVGR